MKDNMKNTQVTEPVEDKSAQPETDPVKDELAEKMFTQDEVNSIIDKRLARERAKFDEQLKTKVNEAERLAKLSEEERKKEELKIQQEQFNAQIKEFEQMKREFERAQLLNETQRQLSERDLPIDVAEMLLGVDADTTKDNIDKFEAKWSESLQKAVNNKLNNSSVSPRTPVRDNAGKKHKNIKDMSLSEYAKYREEHGDK